MKCIPLLWPDEDIPRPTFVLHKREVEVLLDVPNKNPRSQWLSARFNSRRLYVCDAHRILCVTDPEAPEVTAVEVPSYIPVALIKAAAMQKKPSMKMTTALLISATPVGTAGFHVVALETDNKAWDLFPDDVILDKGELIYQAQAVKEEVALTVPRVEMMDKLMDELAQFAQGTEPTARKIRFQPEYLATFGKLASLTKPNIATMHVGAGSLDAGLFQVEAGDGTKWDYVLMPMK